MNKRVGVRLEYNRSATQCITSLLFLFLLLNSSHHASSYGTSGGGSIIHHNHHHASAFGGVRAGREKKGQL